MDSAHLTGTAVLRLAEHAAEATWKVGDLPWGEPHAFGELEVPDQGSLLHRAGLLRGMTPRQCAHAKRREMASHLSALAYGEMKAVTLAAETVLLCPETESEQRSFLGMLLSDESRHHLALRRYVEAQLDFDVPAHPSQDQLFEQLTLERDFGLNLLAGQVVLEGSAASLLNALLVGVRQPLLRELLRRIARDEARHMKFAHLVSPVRGEPPPPARRRKMEEVLFEAAWAASASLLAERVWDELGLDRYQARHATVDALAERGVLNFFTRVVVRQLGLRGFPADALGKRLATQLEDRLRGTV